MRLEELTQTQIGFAFDYVRVRDGLEETRRPGPAAGGVHARGEQRHRAGPRS